MLDIISRIVKDKFKSKWKSNYSMFILINNVSAYTNNRGDILLINKNNNNFES